jgi:ribose 5-phosphate isomerase A
MDQRIDVAREAISFISDGDMVGLGASTTIKHMVDLLAAAVSNGLNIQLATSSFTTKQLLQQQKLLVQPISNFSKIDIYFDGCDQFDRDLNALKSGGGIHTHEKLLASMADQFLLLGDEKKYVNSFDDKYPLVIEFLPEAIHYVPAGLHQLYRGIQTNIRLGDKKEGPAITGNGNYLLDLWFTAWPDLATINKDIKKIVGVVETSLFCNMAHKAIIAEKSGVRIIEKPANI